MADWYKALKPVFIGGDNELHRIATLGELAYRSVAMAWGTLAQGLAGRAVLVGERLARDAKLSFAAANR